MESLGLGLVEEEYLSFEGHKDIKINIIAFNCVFNTNH